jgi:hypothetical protein
MQCIEANHDGIVADQETMDAFNRNGIDVVVDEKGLIQWPALYGG